MPGFLIVNADDWGRDAETTARIFECVEAGGVSSVSAMVFMEDSERAAALAREAGVDAGLHLNLTTTFSEKGCPRGLVERQQDIARYLRRGRFAAVAASPGSDTRVRVRGGGAGRRIPAALRFGARARRRPSSRALVRERAAFRVCFRPARSCAETSPSRPARRACGIGCIGRSSTVRWPAVIASTDFFFSLTPLEPASRLRRIASLARQFAVEVETHPAKPDEHRFLQGGEIFRRIGDVPIVPHRTRARAWPIRRDRRMTSAGGKEIPGPRAAGAHRAARGGEIRLRRRSRGGAARPQAIRHASRSSPSPSCLTSRRTTTTRSNGTTWRRCRSRRSITGGRVRSTGRRATWCGGPRRD